MLDGATFESALNRIAVAMEGCREEAHRAASAACKISEMVTVLCAAGIVALLAGCVIWLSVKAMKR